MDTIPYLILIYTFAHSPVWLKSLGTQVFSKLLCNVSKTIKETFCLPPENIRKTFGFLVFSGGIKRGLHDILHSLWDKKWSQLASWRNTSRDWGYGVINQFHATGHFLFPLKFPEGIERDQWRQMEFALTRSCKANRWNGFFMIETSVMKELTLYTNNSHTNRLHCIWCKCADEVLRCHVNIACFCILQCCKVSKYFIWRTVRSNTIFILDNL